MLVFVLVCMLGWGASVICASISGRTLTTPAVIVSEACGGAMLLVVWLSRITPADRLLGAAHLWGVAAGVTGVIGTYAFYKVISSAELCRMVPLTSLYVALPVLFGALVLRERLTVPQCCGVLLALLSGYLLASGPSEKPVEAPALVDIAG